MVNIYNFDQIKFFTDFFSFANQYHVYDFALGVPDFPIDNRLKELLRESVDYINHGYESLQGNPILIDEIKKFNENREIPLIVKHSEISIVPCATFALFTALKSILNDGDEVIIIEPNYYTYAPVVVLAGGKPIYSSVKEDFSMDWGCLEQNITHKTKVIIVNSPQNPTGKILSKSDWEKLYQLIENTDIQLVSEEVYDMYCYDNRDFYSAFHHPKLKERSFCLFSFGKMFHTSGWKVSYILASEELQEKFRSHQQYISYGVNTSSQYALAKFLPIFNEVENRNFVQNKRDLFCNLIEDTSFKILEKTEGGFYQLLNFRGIDNKMSDVEFCKWLIKEKQISALPLSAFYSSKENSDFIRMSFLRQDDIIINGLEQMITKKIITTL